MLSGDYSSNSIFSILAQNLDEASASSCLMLATALRLVSLPQNPEQKSHHNSQNRRISKNG